MIIRYPFLHSMIHIGPCKETVIDSHVDYYGEQALDAFRYGDIYKSWFRQTNMILISLASTKIEYRKRVERQSLESFIGAVGGSLGLFLGFSFFGAALLIHDYILDYLAKYFKLLINR